MLRWPIRSAAAIARLFRSIQDVDVFVEDQGDEQFYLVLFRAAAPLGVTINRVFGLGGRAAVLQAAEAYVDDRPAVFLIDGDFEWVRDESAPTVARLYRLAAYCIENLLLRGHLISAVLAEEMMCEHHEAHDRFQFDAWESEMLSLLPLVVRCAVLNKVAPEQPIMQTLFGSVVEAEPKGLPRVSAQKLNTRISELDALIVAAVGEVSAREMIEAVSSRVALRANKSAAISGKTLLLPLAYFEAKRRSDCRMSKEVFRYRLATKCDRSDLPDLVAALNAAR